MKRREFWEWVDIGGPDDCWPWEGFCNSDGRGSYHGLGDRRKHSAARCAYILAVRSVGDGEHVHHMCRNVACCNPSHLLALPAKAHWDLHAAETTLDFCGRGHEMVEANLYEYHGHRHCRACVRQRAVEWNQRNREHINEWMRVRRERARREKMAMGTYRPPPGQRTHCPRGHAYAGENLIVGSGGGRECRACRVERDRARNGTAKRREQAAAKERRRLADPQRAAQMREYKRKWAAEKRANDPEFVERGRVAAREYQRRRRQQQADAV